MDINPLLVHGEGEGATLVDCRMILNRHERQARQQGSKVSEAGKMRPTIHDPPFIS